MKISIISILTTIVCLFVSSCTKSGDSIVTNVGNLQLDSIVIDTTAVLATNKPDCKAHIRMSIVYVKNNEAINKAIANSGIFYPENLNTDSLRLQDVVKEFVDKYIADYREDFTGIYSIEDSTTAVQVSYEVSTRIASSSDSTFCYEATISQQSGGPHRSIITMTRNIQVKDGRVLTLDDVFVPGYHDALTELIVARMCDNLDARNLDALREKKVWMAIDPYPSETFIMDGEDYTFIYNADEIASHDLGEIRVTLKASELKKILKR